MRTEAANRLRRFSGVLEVFGCCEIKSHASLREEPLGMWLEDMIETFGMKYTQWTKENHERQEAEHVILG